MDNLPIRFEEVQALTYIIVASLFIYMLIAFITWFVKESKPKRPGFYSHMGRPL